MSLSFPSLIGGTVRGKLCCAAKNSVTLGNSRTDRELRDEQEPLVSIEGALETAAKS